MKEPHVETRTWNCYYLTSPASASPSWCSAAWPRFHHECHHDRLGQWNPNSANRSHQLGQCPAKRPSASPKCSDSTHWTYTVRSWHEPTRTTVSHFHSQRISHHFWGGKQKTFTTCLARSLFGSKSTTNTFSTWFSDMPSTNASKIWAVPLHPRCIA